MIAGLGRRGDGASALASNAAPVQIPYSAEDRKDDVRAGRLDGRRRTPSYTQVSDRIATDGWFTTAYGEQLQELGQTRMHDEVQAYKRLVAPKRRREAGLREQLATTLEDIGRTEEAVRRTGDELDPDELVPRSPTEAQRGTDYIRNRRRSARTRQAQLARDRVDLLNRQVEALRQQIAEECAEMEQDLERAEARVRQQAAHAELRVATYWRALTETHPEGRQLTVVLPRVRLTFPVWDEVADPTDDDTPPKGTTER